MRTIDELVAEVDQLRLKMIDALAAAIIAGAEESVITDLADVIARCIRFAAMAEWVRSQRVANPE